MTRLTDHLNASYLSAANVLRGKKARRKIVAYVESYDDIFFWRTVLSSFEDETRYFEVTLPSHERLERGKKSVLMNLLLQRVGQHMIACVDADYDYLLQGATETSRQVCGSPYVFHTYVYAIENYQCYAPSLHDLCVAATLNDHATFDFEDFFARYSEAIFPLFVWSVWHYRKELYRQFSLSDFNKVIETGTFRAKDAETILAAVRRKVGRKVEQLQKHHPRAKVEWQKLKDELKALGLTPRTTYLYVQGHHLKDNVVVPLLRKVCGQLVQEREGEIRRTAIHGTQCRNELSSYSHSTNDVEPLLRRNIGYMRSEPFQRLQADIARFLEQDGHFTSQMSLVSSNSAKE